MYSGAEALDNAGDLLKGLSKRVATDSDGGKTITMSEWLSLAQEIGLKVIKDVSDDDETPG